jgi:hypothetical protein
MRLRHFLQLTPEIAADCCGSVHSALERREGIAESLYYAWSKEFVEAGKRRLAGDGQRPVAKSRTCGVRRRSSRQWLLNKRWRRSEDQPRNPSIW